MPTRISRHVPLRRIIPPLFALSLVILLPFVAAAADAKSFYVTAVRAELRKGPSYYYPVAVRITQNTKVAMVKRVGQWFQVKSDAGEEGWVTGYLLGDKPVEANQSAPSGGNAAANLADEGAVGGEAAEGEPGEAEEKPATEAKKDEAAPGQKVLVPNKPKIAIRKTAAKTGAVVTMAPEGTEMVVLEQKGPWFRIKTPKGTQGWVSGYDVDLANK